MEMELNVVLCEMSSARYDIACWSKWEGRPCSEWEWLTV